MAQEIFSSWAVVELMGHRRMVGLVTEVEVGGGKLFRCDIPESSGHPAYSQLFGASSVYCLSPVTEEVAKVLIGQARETKPWYAYSIPTSLPLSTSQPSHDYDNGLDDIDTDNLIHEISNRGLYEIAEVRKALIEGKVAEARVLFDRLFKE